LVLVFLSRAIRSDSAQDDKGRLHARHIGPAHDSIALAANEVCYVASLALRSGLRQRGLDVF
jgi:hypothetical protein